MKKALMSHRLYYEYVRITGVADQGVLDAFKKFQKDHGLSATGGAKPDDETIRTLSKETSKAAETVNLTACYSFCHKGCSTPSD